MNPACKGPIMYSKEMTTIDEIRRNHCSLMLLNIVFSQVFKLLIQFYRTKNDAYKKRVANWISKSALKLIYHFLYKCSCNIKMFKRKVHKVQIIKCNPSSSTILIVTHTIYKQVLIQNQRQKLDDPKLIFALF